jgi:hypothetical protein
MAARITVESHQPDRPLLTSPIAEMLDLPKVWALLRVVSVPVAVTCAFDSARLNTCHESMTGAWLGSHGQTQSCSVEWNARAAGNSAVIALLAALSFLLTTP